MLNERADLKFCLLWGNKENIYQSVPWVFKTDLTFLHLKKCQRDSKNQK